MDLVKIDNNKTILLSIVEEINKDSLKLLNYYNGDYLLLLYLVQINNIYIKG